MLVAIAGPYSSSDDETRKNNLIKLNRIAAEVYRLGHIPILGVNAALPIVNELPELDSYDSIMNISMGIVSTCDALLMIEESPGALKEKNLIESQGKPVFYSIEELKFYKK